MHIDSKERRIKYQLYYFKKNKFNKKKELQTFVKFQLCESCNIFYFCSFKSYPVRIVSGFSFFEVCAVMKV